MKVAMKPLVKHLRRTNGHMLIKPEDEPSPETQVLMARRIRRRIRGLRAAMKRSVRK